MALDALDLNEEEIGG